MKTAFLIFFLLLPNLSFAATGDYEKFYEVDLDAPVPDLKSLKKELNELTDDYNSYYLFSWDTGLTFNANVSEKITAYGNLESRIKKDSEEALYQQIANLPKEFYPYIGPNLHAQQGISEKILNMPGIKETKNQFPKVIAPQLQDIEDLEFLSPHLYLLLMPQMWPSNQKPVERPRIRSSKVSKSTYNADFFARVLNKIPDQGFGGQNRMGQTPPQDKLRTLHPTKTSPLTTADIKAFTQTLDAVRSFGTGANFIKINQAGILLDYWEQKNNKALMINGLKDVVNPCQRLALKIKWAGLETEFLKAVAPQAFNLKEWAYTCDKTIKAYRISRMSLAHLTALEAFKKGVFNAYTETLDPKWRENQYLNLQSLALMYKAPKEDVLEALKNESLIFEKITPFGNLLITSPIAD